MGLKRSHKSYRTKGKSIKTYLVSITRVSRVHGYRKMMLDPQGLHEDVESSTTEV